MSIGLSTEVFARNGFGQFIAACRRGATATVMDTIEDGAEIAAMMATKKTGAMAGSIHPVMLSATSGAWVVGTDHWLFQEDGTSPHSITGNVTFWWEREGRPWLPGNNTISHPGNPPVHFMLRSYQVANGRMMGYARKNYP